MVQLRTQRAALALYGVLLILPTLVLGFLQWHQIVNEKENELAAVPRDAESAAQRLRDAIQARLQELIDAENSRSWEQYANWYSPGSATDADAGLLPSPLREDARPTGVLAWFVFDLIERRDAEIDMFWGAAPNAAASRGPELRAAARDLLQHLLDDGELRQAARVGVDLTHLDLPVRLLAINRGSEDDEDCLRAQRMLLEGIRVPMVTSPLHVQFYNEPDGTPRLVATRRVFANPLPHLVGLNECLHRLVKGMGLVQGFFIDPDWFFHELPSQVARSVLGGREHFLRAGETCCEGGLEYRTEVRLVADLGLETYRPEERDHALTHVVIDTAEIEQRFRARVWRFAGVAAMLAASLSTGLVLLWRSIKSDLEQAQRTENFVAAVTHELRTPLASIKMHGEMLLDGWANDPRKQQEYYRRIVRDTERLSTLVERVLEKARLTAGSVRPVAGDLSQAVAALEEELQRWRDAEHPDLAFELAGDLPLVLLTSEAVRSIVVNLVENARKYAPVDFTRPGHEPIRVITRRDGERVVLEVLDRGPGVPAEERERVFQAFYRVGNEATRTSRGTGLGLHLVALHATSLGGSAEVLAREGGGSIFRVVFATAPPDAV